MNARTLLAATAAVALPAVASAQLYSSPVESLSDFDVVATTDASATVVDYSNFLAFSAAQSLPEAPNTAPGDAATTGILFVANQLQGAAAGVNLIPLDATTSAPQTFAGTYTLQFDMYASVAIPIPTGGTEQTVFGVGSNTNDPFFGFNDTVPSGIYGQASTEGGYGTIDYALYSDDGTDIRLGNDTLFDDTGAFPDGPLAGTPGNTWRTYNITVDPVENEVEFYIDGVFILETTALDPTDLVGSLFVGYGDSFGSISAGPDEQYGVIDNIQVLAGEVVVPEPATLSLLGAAGLGLIRRRK